MNADFVEWRTASAKRSFAGLYANMAEIQTVVGNGRNAGD